MRSAHCLCPVPGLVHSEQNKQKGKIMHQFEHWVYFSSSWFTGYFFPQAYQFVRVSDFTLSTQKVDMLFPILICILQITSKMENFSNVVYLLFIHIPTVTCFFYPLTFFSTFCLSFSYSFIGIFKFILDTGPFSCTQKIAPLSPKVVF